MLLLIMGKLEGIFYGLGRTRYSFFVETAGMWGVRILFTFLCVRSWNLGLRAVWYCMIADNVCKALLFAAPFYGSCSQGRLGARKPDSFSFSSMRSRRSGLEASTR